MVMGECNMPKYEDIKLIHGSGGQVMSQLINELIVKRVKLPNVSGGIGLKQLDDGASIPLKTGEIVLTSDSYTVEPIFFPGGNIGVLAVCGTINDLAMMGAKPLALMDTIVVEEGFPIAKKYHGPDFLLDNRHLWIRSQKMQRILQIRARLLKAAREWLDGNGFTEFHAPILITAACEGGATLFTVKYFDREAYLTQSWQLYAEAAIVSYKCNPHEYRKTTAAILEQVESLHRKDRTHIANLFCDVLIASWRHQGLDRKSPEFISLWQQVIR